MANKSNKSNKTTTVESTTEVVSEVATVLAEATVQLAETATVVATTEHKLTKADTGRTIFNEELATGTLVRKTTIDRLMKEAGLTKAGAATYFQNMKKKAGLVHSTVTTA